MKDKKNQKWLDEKMTQASDFGEVRFDAQQWKQKYVLNESRKSSFPYKDFKPQKNTWRLIMESKVTKYSAAAVVILAVTLVLFGPFGTPGNGGVALADVQRKLADAESMIIRGTKTFMRPGEDGDVIEINGLRCEFDLVKYSSKQHGLVEEGRVDGKLIYRITFNRPKRQSLLVLPPWKKYGAMTSTDEQMRLMENLSPAGIINMLLAGDHKELGRDTIDGVEVEGFEFQQPDVFVDLFPRPIVDVQSLRGKVWIGIEEQLPIWVEGDFFFGKSLLTLFNEVRLHEVNVVEKYDVELDEKIFDTDVPEDYTEFGLGDILPFIPIETKAGIASLGIIPAGLILWKRQRRRKTMTHSL
ncbi:MAG: hypothetical protein ACYTDV_19255 [Planctomycetota bacterium]|jgi:hypothetical protein